MSTVVQPMHLPTTQRHLDHRRVGMPFPPDRRERVQQTTQAPWSGVGLVSARFPNGTVAESTGFVIDSRSVVIAAHSIFNRELGGMATDVVFECARDATRTPFGVVHASAWFKPAEYPTGGRPYDYGLLKLATALPSGVCRYLLHAATDKELQAGEFQIAGYPEDKAPENSMWYDSGRLLSPPGSRILRYRISTNGGESGAAVSSYLDTAPRAVGIHVGSAEDRQSNEAVRVTQEVIDQIERWRMS